MRNFGILVKSFAGDFEYASRCVSSFHANNPTAVQMYLVVPESDMALFAQLAGSNVEVLSESLLSQYLTDVPLNGMRPGYVNQEIVKLAFWELGLLENYLCVDSDALFIRPISADDFMFDATTPYTVLVEDKDLLIQPRYFRDYWVTREEALRRIQLEVGLDVSVLRTCHGHQVMSAAVLKDFKKNFLDARGWTYIDALAVAPYEFTWYNMWAQKCGVIPIVSREPFAKVFHNEDQHLDALVRGMTVQDIARAYPLLVVNSNFSRDLGVIDPAASKPEVLSRYLSYGELLQLARAKVRDTWSRRIRRT